METLSRSCDIHKESHDKSWHVWTEEETEIIIISIIRDLKKSINYSDIRLEKAEKCSCMSTPPSRTELEELP